jgi:hypothetical protein
MISDILQHGVSEVENAVFQQQVNKFEVKVVRIVRTQLLILRVHLLEVDYLELHLHLRSSEVFR